MRDWPTSHVDPHKQYPWPTDPQPLAIKPIDGDVTGLPEKAHGDDAAYDLRAANPAVLMVGETKLIRCGFAMALPKRHVGMVCSRSGLASKYGVFVLNAPGLIDEGYRGEVGVVLHNAGTGSFHVHPGDRIAQLLVVRAADVFLNLTNRLPDSLFRGVDGFGSTGQ